MFGHETVEFRRYVRAAILDHGSVSMSFYGASSEDSQKAGKYVAKGKLEAAQILQLAIK